MLTIVEEKGVPAMEREEPGAGCWRQAASRIVTSVKGWVSEGGWWEKEGMYSLRGSSRCPFLGGRKSILGRRRCSETGSRSRGMRIGLGCRIRRRLGGGRMRSYSIIISRPSKQSGERMAYSVKQGVSVKAVLLSKPNKHHESAYRRLYIA